MAMILNGAQALVAEPIVVGAVVQPPGSIGSGRQGGVVGRAAAAAIERGDRGKHRDVVRTSPIVEGQRGFLAVTATRLVVMLAKNGFWTKKADSVLTEVSRDEIVGADFDPAILSALVITFRDGTEWHFSVVKIDARNARAVVDALTAG